MSVSYEGGEVRDLSIGDRRIIELSSRYARGELCDADYATELAFIQRRQASARSRCDQRPTKLARPAPSSDRKQYARISAAIYEDPRMCDSARRLVAHLIKMARGRPTVSGYVMQWADDLQLSRRQIQYAQHRAEECGYIDVKRIRKGRINDANVYEILAPSLPETAPKPRRKCRRRTPQAFRPPVVVGVQNFAPHEETRLKKSGTPLPPRGNEAASALSADLRSPAATAPAQPAAPPIPETQCRLPAGPPTGGETALPPGRQPTLRPEPPWPGLELVHSEAERQARSNQPARMNPCIHKLMKRRSE